VAPAWVESLREPGHAFCSEPSCGTPGDVWSGSVHYGDAIVEAELDSCVLGRERVGTDGAKDFGRGQGRPAPPTLCSRTSFSWPASNRILALLVEHFHH
jgi:hypothetical protein